MEINKTKDGYSASGLNSNGRFVQAQITGLETVEQVEQILLSVKSKIEAEKEKAENDKEFLLEEFTKGKTDEELLAKKDIFPVLKEEMAIKKDHIYNYIGELYKALDSFTYDVQMSPKLEPKKWKKIGEKKLSKYDEVLKGAKNWMREDTYQKNDYVKYYSKLYQAQDKISDGTNPEKGGKWKEITREMLKDESI